MPIVQINVKLTDQEKALLAKRAKANELTEADYFRVCMILEGVMDGDKDAIRITGGHLREKLARSVSRLGLFTDAPVKA